MDPRLSRFEDNARRLGWTDRGYHPHFDPGWAIQGITFRLADSVAAKLILQWREQLGAQPQGHAATNLRRKITEAEDAGHGACLLRHAPAAAAVQDTLLEGIGRTYHLLEWCVMPNHVHALIRPLDTPVSTIVQRWKSFTAREVNRILGRSGRLWAPDYFDRAIRSLRHLENARRYIRQNPMSAGLCARPEDWRWSSAYASGAERAGTPTYPG